LQLLKSSHSPTATIANIYANHLANRHVNPSPQGPAGPSGMRRKAIEVVPVYDEMDAPMAEEEEEEDEDHAPECVASCSMRHHLPAAFMLVCEQCSHRFHPACLGLSEEEARCIDDNYRCHKCVPQAQQSAEVSPPKEYGDPWHSAVSTELLIESTNHHGSLGASTPTMGIGMLAGLGSPSALAGWDWPDPASKSMSLTPKDPWGDKEVSPSGDSHGGSSSTASRSPHNRSQKKSPSLSNGTRRGSFSVQVNTTSIFEASQGPSPRGMTVQWNEASQGPSPRGMTVQWKSPGPSSKSPRLGHHGKNLTIITQGNRRASSDSRVTRSSPAVTAAH